MVFSRFRIKKGQATVELALVLLFGVLPLSFGLIAFFEAGWAYHGLGALARLGGADAPTRCFQDSSGQNVVSWLTDLNNAALPIFPVRQQLASGGIQITVQYWTHDPDQGSIPVLCSASCDAQCVPDSVTVGIATSNPNSYQFNRFLTSFGLPVLQLPAFSTTVPMESGVDP